METKKRKIFITSDTHFFHKNIIAYCNRPFESVPEMNDVLIKNWNNAVSPNDIVIFCGDFCFARTASAFDVTAQLTSMLNGNKIIIKGNHDFKKFRYTDCGWKAEYYQEWVFNNRFSFRHRPDNIQNDANKFDFIFYGHVHDKIINDAPTNTINVCVDVNNFTPIDITNYFTDNEIKKIYSLIVEA